MVMVSDEEDSGDEEGESSSGSDDVDEKGMNRLIELLGDDGLDDLDKYQLGLLSKRGETDEEDDDSAVNKDEELVEKEEGEEEEEEEPTSAMAEALEDVDLEDVSSVDEDAVPRQKILINNAVCTLHLFIQRSSLTFLILISPDCTGAHSRHHKARWLTVDRDSGRHLRPDNRRGRKRRPQSRTRFVRPQTPSTLLPLF